MAYAPRTISFLGRKGQTKLYGISTHAGPPHPALVEATGKLAEPDTPGFTIAHEGTSAGLGLSYWWANENELHARFFASSLQRPGELEPYTGRGITCVWEMEVMDFERRAWIEDVLKAGDVEAYLSRALEPVAV
jgi:hypothetical protein